MDVGWCPAGCVYLYLGGVKGFRERPGPWEATAVDFLKASWRRLPRWAQVAVKVLVFVFLLSLWWLLAVSGRDSFLPR
jgi:hypothetical protein